MNQLDHHGSLSKLKSGNRPDRNGASTTVFLQQQRLVKDVRQRFAGLSKSEAEAFWAHEQFARKVSKEERTVENVQYLIEQANNLDELCALWASSATLHAFVARLMLIRTGEPVSRAKRQKGGSNEPE